MTLRALIVCLVLLAGIAQAGFIQSWFAASRPAAGGGGGPSFPSGLIDRWTLTASNEWAVGAIANTMDGRVALTQAVSSVRGAWVGPGVQFNGSDTKWFLPTNSCPKGPFTFVVCAKYPTSPAGYQRLVSYSSYNTEANWNQLELFEFPYDASALNFYSLCTLATVAQGQINALSYSSTNVTLSVAWTFETNNANMYVNGILYGTDTSYNWACDPSKQTPLYCALGWASAASVGLIYEVEIYNRGLLSNEVLSVHNTVKGLYP